jgi:hypothetical protein
MAISGKFPAAAIFWLKTRAGWRETNIIEHSGPQGGPLEVLHGGIDQRITNELARVAAARNVAEIPEAPDAQRESGVGVPVAGLEGPAEPTGPHGS